MFDYKPRDDFYTDLRLSFKDKENPCPTISAEPLSTYFTYIESLESGSTVSGERFINEDEVLSPYISKQYEIGAKYSLNDKALLTASIFRIEKSNAYDVEDTSLPDDVERRFTRTRDGLQVHQGLELSLTGKISKYLTLVTGGTVLDAKIKKNNDPKLEGKSPTGISKTMLKVYAEYAVAGIEGLVLSGGAYYTGKKFHNAANIGTVPAYTIFDAGARYATRLGGYATTFNLTVQNMADKVYWSSTSAFGDPRTFALTVKTHF